MPKHNKARGTYKPSELIIACFWDRLYGPFPVCKKKVESDVIMKVEAANEVESKLSMMKPEAVKVEEVQCSMSIMKPEACNASKKKTLSILRNIRTIKL